MHLNSKYLQRVHLGNIFAENDELAKKLQEKN